MVNNVVLILTSPSYNYMYGEHNATHIKTMPHPGVFRQSGTQVRGGKGFAI